VKIPRPRFIYTVAVIQKIDICAAVVSHYRIVSSGWQIEVYGRNFIARWPLRVASRWRKIHPTVPAINHRSTLDAHSKALNFHARLNVYKHFATWTLQIIIICSSSPREFRWFLHLRLFSSRAWNDFVQRLFFVSTPRTHTHNQHQPNSNHQTITHTYTHRKHYGSERKKLAEVMVTHYNNIIIRSSYVT